MNKSEEILFEYGFTGDINGSEPISLLPLTIADMMEEYGREFAYFLLKNAMLNARGKLYLKLTDEEIIEIIENSLKEFENI